MLTRCFEHERRFYLGVSVLGFVPLAAEAPLLSEISLWSFVGDRLGKDAALDAGVPKCRGEFLVDGRAYAPGGIACPAVPVRATVGGLQKSLSVFGDRYWQSGRVASEAQPFTEMPLHWSRAYGGPKYAMNPLGRGHGETELYGQRIQLLPNVERPGFEVQSAGQRPDPAGFGPVDLSWPQRQALVGTYDAAWLEHLFPGFARDIDWGFFNLAPRDQQREGFWEGGEDYCFDNLHPSKAQLRGRLPTYVARAFVSRVTPGTRLPVPEERYEEASALEPKLEEVALRLQTLWFFPDVERAVLIYQGSLEIATDDATDVRHLVVAGEHSGEDQRRPLAHYAKALSDRLHPDKGIFAGLRDRELLPEGMDEVVDEVTATERALNTSEGLLEANLYRKAAYEHELQIADLVARGVDPSLHPAAPEPPEPPPKLDELSEVIEQLVADAEAKQVEESERLEGEKAQMYARAEAAGLDAEAMRADHESPQVGPPTFTAEGQREALRSAIAQCKLAGAEAEAFEQMLADPELQASWEQAERDAREGYRVSAHLQPPAPRLDPSRREEARAAVQAALASADDFGTLNLTGADLSGMDLRGAQLAGACFESVNLDGCDLSGADLTNAILAHASLVGAKLDGCVLEGTNLGAAKLEGASLRQASLRQTTVQNADFSGASLEGAKLVEVLMLGVKLVGADLSGIETEELSFLEVEIRGLKARNARLFKCLFAKLDLADADFSGSCLDHCSFIRCRAPGVNFTGASLRNASFVEGCVLDGALFTQSMLTSCNLRGSSMKGCELSKANLDAADLSECDLTGARLYQAVARATRFDKADLSEAVLLSANLMGSSFLGATIRGADLRATNLYGADMARVRSDARVQLDEAILTKVRVQPTHVEVPDDT